MKFYIDRQTIEELNLMGKFRQGSVYHLFNQVKSRGAEKLLEEMFQEPFLHPDDINQRTQVFSCFQQVKPEFPFDVQQLTLMRDYLDDSSGSNPVMVLAKTVVSRCLSALTHDEQYKKTVQGLQATIVTLSSCYYFIDVSGELLENGWNGIGRMKAILSDLRLIKLGNTDIYKGLTLRSLAHYDHLLRNRLRNQLNDLLLLIYELDVNITVSTVARTRRFNYATALPAEKNCFKATNLFHPCLQKAIGNEICLNEKNNMLFLTGANMAGKSTWMKTVGINLYLAQMGFPVAADSLEFSVREGLYTSINVSDNISLGYSHFYAEVRRVKEAAQAVASGKRLMLMFDELFKGTNVKDAYDGTLAVSIGFAEYRNCLFIVSTHIIEVGVELRKYSNIRFAYMPTVMKGNIPQYTYQLKEGITEDRQGMMIIRNEGILEMIQS